MIRQKINGMKAGEVQRIAARFLPSMGKTAPVGKAKIAGAMTDTSAFSLLNPAAELGVELSESVKRALMADREGRVDEVGPKAAPEINGDELERKTDEVMEKVVAPGMLNFTRDQVRALIQEKGVAAADKTIADYQQGTAKQAETIRKYSEAKEKADRARQAQAEAAKSDQAAAEPNPLEHTPKQYADAWLRWSAEINALPLADVREMQGDEAGLKAIEQRWVDAVVNQAKSGQSLPAKTLDKLLEIRPNTVLPESAIPAGYQRPEARKLEKAQKSAPAENELEAIFSGLESDGLKKRRAESALKERPDAEVINQVESQFYDMLLSLMERGDLEVNGHKTIHKDNKSCL